MKRLSLVLIALLLTLLPIDIYTYQIGLGRADCTGPSVEIAFVGFGIISCWEKLFSLKI